MRIVAIADDDIRALDGLPDTADLVISLGGLWETTILEVAKRTGAEKIFAIKGSHDGTDEFPGQFIDMHRRAVRFGKWTFGGFGGAFKQGENGGPNHYDQEDVEYQLDGFPTVDIFLAHNSPSGIHERDDTVHQGFRAFNQLIKTTKPYIFMHGHQHIAQNSHLEDTEIIGVFGNAVIELA